MPKLSRSSTRAPRNEQLQIGSFEEPSDAALVISIARFDEAALAEVYGRYASAVYALACRVLRDRSGAEEIVQEVFLRLWNDPTRFDPDRGALRSYLLTQAHGRSIDALRSGTARRAREGRDAVARSDVKNVEDAVIDLSTAVSVKRAVDLLPDDERQAIDLAYFGGHSYREVAVLLSQPEGTIKSRIRSGLKRLREQLTAEGATQVWAQ